MHELSVTENILSLVRQYAHNANARKVTDIYLIIGRLAGIIDDSVQFYWDILCKDTLCEGSQLHFRHIPATMLCQDCGNEYTLERELTPCTACGSPKVTVIAGDEFMLESIEIER